LAATDQQLVTLPGGRMKIITRGSDQQCSEDTNDSSDVSHSALSPSPTSFPVIRIAGLHNVSPLSQRAPPQRSDGSYESHILSYF